MTPFLEELKTVATHPYAFIAYIVLISLWAAVAIKTHRLKTIAQVISTLPEAERRPMLEKDYGYHLKEGMSSEDFLRAQRMKFIFLGFMAALSAGVLLLVIAMLRDQPQRGRLSRDAIDRLFALGWQEQCSVFAPGNWSVTLGHPELMVEARPSPASPFGDYDFVFKVSWHTRSIDLPIYDKVDDNKYWHVDSLNKESLFCDIPEKTFSLTRGGNTIPEDPSIFLAADGALPAHARAFAININAIYEDGTQMESCQVPVSVSAERQTASVTVDNIVHFGPKQGEVFGYVMFSCAASPKMEQEAFDLVCKTLIEKMTTSQNFFPEPSC